MKPADRKRLTGLWATQIVQWILFWLLLAGAWQLLSLWIHNALICPSPLHVLREMMRQILLPGFWQSLAATVLRALLALGLSFLAALPIAFLSAFYAWIGGFFNRLVSLMQTVPNVCYIILLLFWTGRTQTVILTGFFLLFPLIYRGLYEQLCALRRRWRDVWVIYPQPTWILMRKICLPQLRPALSAAIKTASSLSFKVCVTSEILAGLSTGIGKKIQTARFDLNLAGVAGWSLWLVLLVFCFEKIWGFLLSRLPGSDSI